MDQDKMLADLRLAITAYRECEDFDTADDVAERAEELDSWLTSGGCIPAEWSHARNQKGIRGKVVKEVLSEMDRTDEQSGSPPRYEDYLADVARWLTNLDSCIGDHDEESASLMRECGRK